MICRVISRRIQKLDLGDSYKRQFQGVLESIQGRYRCDRQSKAFLIKKICTKYLKICNSFLPCQPVQQSLSALQFIKSLQLDIYEGKSYQLYIIKITMHILYIRCYDLKLEQLKIRSSTTTIKKRSFQQQQREWSRRRYRYIERLKMFCAQIQQCYFSVYLLKDYYSNLQQLYFLCLKHQMQKIVDNFYSLGQTQYVDDSFQFDQVNYYINKLYQLLKNHLLELNQMLVYQQKKVYQILTVKIYFMIDTFILNAVVKFVQYADQERMSRSQAQQSTQIQGIKEKFIDQQIQHLWENYHTIFSKMPNHIDHQLILHKFQQIVKSLTQKLQNPNPITHKVDTNKFQSLSNIGKSLTKNNQFASKSEIKQNAELNDFMSFGQQTYSINKIESSTSLQKQKIEPFSNLQTKGQFKSNINFQEKRKKRQQISFPTTQQKGVTQNLSLGLASDGFRRLNSLKTPSLNMLQKIKNTQFQRLRRINSTDLIRTLKTPSFEPLKVSQKKKDRRSKTQYFPFIGESKESNNKDLFNQFSNSSKKNNYQVNKILLPFRQPDSTAKSPTNNLITNQSKPKQPLKLKQRSMNKRTTLDMMNFERKRNSFEKRESKDFNSSEIQNIFSFAEVNAKSELEQSLSSAKF